MLQPDDQPQKPGAEAWIVFRPGLIAPPPPLPRPSPLPELPCASHSGGHRAIKRVVRDRVLPELLARFRERGQV